MGTAYIPSAWVGTAGKLTWAMIDKPYSAGWAIGCDGTSDDTSMTAKGTVAAMMADLNCVRSALAAQGYTRGVKGLLDIITIEDVWTRHGSATFSLT